MCVCLSDPYCFKAVVVKISPLLFFPFCVLSQAAELQDLSVSACVVISDCYSPDNDALAL